MKKSMLAMSVAAAIGGLGFAGSALAIQDQSGSAATATEMVVNSGGFGHQLLFPYFSTQGDNATLINVVNTDTVGKVVKFRFRGAGNSDDLLDFQVLMSPGDMWTAAVTQDAASGKSKLTTTDSSCTVGLSLDGAVKGGSAAAPLSFLFATTRTDPKKDAGETREGYLEVINMADIITGSDLYKTTKHSSATKTPECSANVIEASLGTDPLNEAAAVARGMTNPTIGLVGDWILLNQANTAAWSGSATALAARVSPGVAGTGRIVFWPQKFGAPTPYTTTGNLGQVTADTLFLAGKVTPQLYDLPDLSTPYVGNGATNSSSAGAQADATTAVLAVQSVANEYVTADGIAAVTDWLFSQPTRRYHVAVDYTTTLGDAIYRASSAYYNEDNIEVRNRQVCLNNTQAPGSTVISFTDAGSSTVRSSVGALFDREETTPGRADNPFVPSPNEPTQAKKTYLCGEANVFSINAGSVTDASALNASVARGDLTFTDAAYTDGWASWGMGNGSTGIPVLGAAFIRASNGAVNYGFAFPHKTLAGVAPTP